MEVEFVIQTQDLLALRKYHRAHPTKAERRLRVVGGFLGASLPLAAAAGALLLQVYHLVPLLYSVLCLLFGSCFFLLAVSELLRWSIRSALKRRERHALGWQRLAINSDGLVVTTELLRTEMKWAALHKIALAEGYAFLYISDDQAVILPRRPFAGDEEFQQFLTAARRYWKAAREAATTAPASPTSPRDDETGITPDERADR
jgi:hypothetical protein